MADMTWGRLRSLLDYEPATGLFRWRAHRRNGVKPGDVARRKHSNGYITIRVDGCDYLAHRLAWFWVMGEWPAVTIDHRDMA